MFCSTENNQHRTPSQCGDFSWYVKILYFSDGCFGLWFTYVSVLLERQISILAFFLNRDYDDLGSFPMKWLCD